MKRGFLGVIGIIASCMVAVLVSVPAFATGWESSPVFEVARAEMPGAYPTSFYGCPAHEQAVEVKDVAVYSKACVFGEPHQFRVARLDPDLAKFAISFPNHQQFYEVRGLCPRNSCVYGAGTDTLLVHQITTYPQYGASVYKNLSKSIVRHYDPSVLRHYYQFTPSKPPDLRISVGTSLQPVEAMSMSANGEWGMVEIKGQGLVRVNMKTLETKRVIAPGYAYGVASDPYAHMAITNDGRYMALGGHNLGTSLYAITDECGDQLVPGMGQHFSTVVVPCKSIAYGVYTRYPGLTRSYDMQFSPDGTRMGMTLLFTTGRVERVILSTAALQGSVEYLALGDSFTSGEGELDDRYYREGSNVDKLKCHVSTRSYPYLVAGSWEIQGQSVACSGAKTNDIYNRSPYLGQNSYLEGKSISQQTQLRQAALGNFQSGIVKQVEFVAAYQPKVVSVGIGGNDAGLVGKLSGCLGLGDCEWVTNPSKVAATAKEIATVYSKVRDTLRTLKHQAPNTKYLMVGYPNIINDSPNAQCDTLTGKLLSQREREFVSESITYLNKVVQAAANVEKVPFVDVGTRFNGVNLCGSTDASAMNGVRFGDDIAPIDALKDFRAFGAESFHPTPKGHVLIAQAIHAKFTTPQAVQCTGCTAEERAPAPSDYWHTTGIGVVTRQFEDISITNDVHVLGENFVITTESNTFMPGTDVIAELHSTVIQINTAKANDNGAYKFDAKITTDIQPGYHTLHLLGTGMDGEPVNVYKTVAVQASREPVVYIPEASTPPASPATSIPPKSSSTIPTLLYSNDANSEGVKKGQNVTQDTQSQLQSYLPLQFVTTASTPTPNKQGINPSVVLLVLAGILGLSSIYLTVLGVKRIKTSRDHGG